MSNRAVITIGKAGDTPEALKNKPAIYLHWNGGIESVAAFLAASKHLGIRSPGSDSAYFMGRFTQVIGNFFGGSLSLGIGTVASLDSDNGDNGLYVVGGDFEIVARHYAPGEGLALPAEYSQDKHAEFVAAIVDKNAAFFAS